VYPSRGYHDAWGSLLGNGNKKQEECWDWEGVRRYYRKFQILQKPSEDVRRQLEIGNFGWEGVVNGVSRRDGQRIEGEGIRASFPTMPHVLQKAWVDAIQDLGWNTLKDPVDGDVIGGSMTTNAIDTSKGERSHTGVAFLEPSKKRENLVIRSNVLVEKIHFHENEQDGNLVATGVLYSQGEGQGNVTVHARKEVFYVQVHSDHLKYWKFLVLGGVKDYLL
jgi:choline dehydrogenase-like flavoprotein